MGRDRKFSMNPALQGYIAHNTVHSLADGFKLSGLIQNVSYDPEGKTNLLAC